VLLPRFGNDAGIGPVFLFGFEARHGHWHGIVHVRHDRRAVGTKGLQESRPNAEVLQDP